MVLFSCYLFSFLVLVFFDLLLHSGTAGNPVRGYAGRLGDPATADYADSADTETIKEKELTGLMWIINKRSLVLRMTNPVVLLNTCSASPCSDSPGQAWSTPANPCYRKNP